VRGTESLDPAHFARTLWGQLQIVKAFSSFRDKVETAALDGALRLAFSGSSA
jgi:hypothetical protein